MFHRMSEYINYTSGLGLRSFIELVCPDQIWATDCCYTAVSIACHRPFFCLSVYPYSNYKPPTSEIYKSYNEQQLVSLINDPPVGRTPFEHYYNYTSLRSDSIVSRDAIQVLNREGHFTALFINRTPGNPSINIRPKHGLQTHLSEVREREEIDYLNMLLQ